jgi:putative tricarboxylic transport membrane protein
VKINDAVSGALLLAGAAAIALYARTLPSIPGQQYGAGAFPLVIAGGLAACALLLVARGLRTWHTVPLVTAPPWGRDRRLVVNLLATLAALLAYVLFSEAIGFIPFSIAILFLLFILFGARPLPSIVVAVLATLAIHFAFYKLLRVPLPWGVLTPFAW